MEIKNNKYHKVLNHDQKVVNEMDQQQMDQLLVKLQREQVLLQKMSKLRIHIILSDKK